MPIPRGVWATLGLRGAPDGVLRVVVLWQRGLILDCKIGPDLANNEREPNAAVPRLRIKAAF